MADFKDAVRRIITGDNDAGESVIIIDGGPSVFAGDPNLGGLFEIWEDAASGPLNPRDHTDLGTTRAVLGPRPGNVQVRWFVVSPLPEGVPKAEMDATTRAVFASFGGERHIIDQSRASAMHETHSIDVICLLQGDASLILEGAETRIKPGQVVVDLGAAPGAWSQYVRRRFAPAGAVAGSLPGTIIALDLLAMEPIEGVEFLQGDFHDDAVLQALEQRLAGRPVDVVVSDMAPNLSGIASTDAARVAALVESAVDFALRHLRPEGALVCKCFHGSGYDALVRLFKASFRIAKPFKPKASRDKSAETFLVGMGPRAA